MKLIDTINEKMYAIYENKCSCNNQVFLRQAEFDKVAEELNSKIRYPAMSIPLITDSEVVTVCGSTGLVDIHNLDYKKPEPLKFEGTATNINANRDSSSLYVFGSSLTEEEKRKLEFSNSKFKFTLEEIL